MPADIHQLPDMMTVPEAASVLRMSARAYYYHAQRGRVPSVKIGYRVYVPKAKLLAFLGVGPDAGNGIATIQSPKENPSFVSRHWDEPDVRGR